MSKQKRTHQVRTQSDATEIWERQAADRLVVRAAACSEEDLKHR